MYIGFPLHAGLLVHELGFFTFLFFTIGAVSLLCAVFYRKEVVSGFSVPLFILPALLFTFLFLFLNSMYNIYIAALSIVMICLNITALVSSQLIKNKKILRQFVNEQNFYKKIDMTRNYPRLKTSILLLSLITISVVGLGAYTSGGMVISIKAPDDFTTISSYWGTPSTTLVEINQTITPVDNNTLLISNASLSSPVHKLINGSVAYVQSVTIGNDNFNYCNYSAGARSYPNGTVTLSQSLPTTTDVRVIFKFVYNHEVFQYLNLGNSTCIMNFGMYYNHVYEESNFFEYIDFTNIFQLMDFWNVKYYINVENPHDYPHMFNAIDTMPMCYAVLDWFDYQRDLGLGKCFVGISPDFESGEYEKLFLGNSTAPQPEPGSLLPGIVAEDNWYNYNSQDLGIFAQSMQLWENVYNYASSLGYTSYAVFQGNAMRDVIDGDIDTTRLPIYPISSNPDVRYGIMSYVDAQDDVEGGRYHQYKDCHDQIAIYGAQGRSILTGWIWEDRGYYTPNALGLGRYIEDILICQAAGMTEVFHAPISKMQEIWGDEAILIVHQALNEWEKEMYRIHVPSWEYSDDYMDAVKNFNQWWLFIPILCVICVKLTILGFMKPPVLRNKRTVES